MKKLLVLSIVALAATSLVVGGCQAGPATFTEVLELSAQKVTLDEASNVVGWEIPVPSYLPQDYKIQEVYVMDSSVGLLISDEEIEKELVTHTDAAGTRQRYEYQSKMGMSISWHSQGVAGGLKLPGDRVMIGETQGVIFDAGDHNNLWWQPRPDPEQPGMFEIVLSASKRITKKELTKIAESVRLLSPLKEEITMSDGEVETHSDECKTINVHQVGLEIGEFCMKKWLCSVSSFTAVALLMTGCLTSADKYTDEIKTINVSVSEEFTISLRVTPRLGESWEESHDENLLTLLESEIIMDNPQEPVSGNAAFLFKALEKGKTEITFTLRHGATGPVKDQKVFKVDIK